MELRRWLQILDETVGVSRRANSFMKVMDPSVLSLLGEGKMGTLAFTLLPVLEKEKYWIKTTWLYFKIFLVMGGLRKY